MRPSTPGRARAGRRVAARVREAPSGELAVHAADPGGRRGVRAERPADLLRLECDGEPRIPRGRARDEVWFPSGKLYVAGDGTIVSPLGLGSGSVYTVDSQVNTATPHNSGPTRTWRSLRPRSGRRSSCRTRTPAYRRWPVRSPRRDTNTYDKVQSLIHWIGAHTHYSENIPPLPPGADTVDEFLFGNRVGFCEQISTSLGGHAALARHPRPGGGGYVPGGFNPITDLYQVHANDAHAWVQVWFPGYGWQDFDPTAVVPVTPPSPGATALRAVGPALGRIPPVPAAAVVVVAGLVVVFVRWRRARPATWAEHVARRAERAGRRAGRPRRPCRDPGRIRRPARWARWARGARGCHLEPVGLGGGGERLRGARPAPGDAARPGPGGQAGHGSAPPGRRSGRHADGSPARV